MANASEIRDQLAKLLMNENSLSAFEDWFIPYSWNIHKHGDEAAQKLAYAIQHALAEHNEDSDSLRLGLMQAFLESLGLPPISSNQSGDSPQIEDLNVEVAFNQCVA